MTSPAEQNKAQDVQKWVDAINLKQKLSYLPKVDNFVNSSLIIHLTLISCYFLNGVTNRTNEVSCGVLRSTQSTVPEQSLKSIHRSSVQHHLSD